MTLGDWIDRFGEPAVEKLAQRLGGRRVYIPAGRLLPDGLRDALGEQADELRSSHAGLRVEIPPLIAVQRERARRGVRHQALNLIASGLSDRDVARTTGLSRRSVARLRSVVVREADGDGVVCK